MSDCGASLSPKRQKLRGRAGGADSAPSPASACRRLQHAGSPLVAGGREKPPDSRQASASDEGASQKPSRPSLPWVSLGRRRSFPAFSGSRRPLGCGGSLMSWKHSSGRWRERVQQCGDSPPRTCGGGSARHGSPRSVCNNADDRLGEMPRPHTLGRRRHPGWAAPGRLPVKSCPGGRRRTFHVARYRLHGCRSRGARQRSTRWLLTSVPGALRTGDLSLEG